jgi:hypothetical protein
MEFFFLYSSCLFGATISLLYRIVWLCFPLIVIELLQTPNSPIAPGSSGGRKTSNRIILVCHGSTQSNTEVRRNGQKV